MLLACHEHDEHAPLGHDVVEQFAEMGGVAGVLNFNCILRTLDLEAKGVIRRTDKPVRLYRA